LEKAIAGPLLPVYAKIREFSNVKFTSAEDRRGVLVEIMPDLEKLSVTTHVMADLRTALKNTGDIPKNIMVGLFDELEVRVMMFYADFQSKRPKKSVKAKNPPKNKPPKKKRKKVLPSSFVGIYNDEILYDKFEKFLIEIEAALYLGLHSTLRTFSRTMFPGPEDREAAAQEIIKEVFSEKYGDKIVITPNTVSDLQSAAKLDDFVKSMLILRYEMENVLEINWVEFVKRKQKSSKRFAKFFGAEGSKGPKNHVESRGLTKSQKSKSDGSPKTKEKRQNVPVSPTKISDKLTFHTIFVDGEIFEQFLQFLTRTGSPLHLPAYVHIRHFLSLNTGRLSAEEVRVEATKISDMLGVGDILTEETVAKIGNDLSAEKVPYHIFDNAYRELGNFLTDQFDEFAITLQ